MKKEIAYYMDLDYPITVETYTEDEEVHYSLEIPDLPGCGVEAKTLAEAMEKLQDAKGLWISASLKRKLPIPEPVSEDDFSGKFLLRIPTKLHMALAKQAKKEGISLNQYVKSVLERHTALAYEKEKIEERDDRILQQIKLWREKGSLPATTSSSSTTATSNAATAGTTIPPSSPQSEEERYAKAA